VGYYTSCCKFPASVVNVSLSKIMNIGEHLGKVIAIIQRVTFYWSVLYFLLSNPALTPLQKRPFQLAKCQKIRDFNVNLIFEKFSPDLHAEEELRRPCYRPHPLASLPSTPPPSNSWDLFGPPKNFGVAPPMDTLCSI